VFVCIYFLSSIQTFFDSQSTVKFILTVIIDFRFISTYTLKYPLSGEEISQQSAQGKNDSSIKCFFSRPIIFDTYPFLILS
jgi:hypothetical protein